MKTTLIFLIVSLFAISSYSQDTLQTQDLTSAGDTFVISTGNFTGFDSSATGANYTWDFSALVRTGQRIDTMLSVFNTNLAFIAVFGFGTNSSDQASRGANTTQGGNLSLSDVYNFYNNSSTEFKQTGFGAVISGAPLAIPYSPHDTIYRFPMIYGNSDSCKYNYAINLTVPLGIYFKAEKSRHDSIDGWGQLTTPFGTFSVLRVVSTIIEADSIHLDTPATPFPLGFNIPPVITKEYKWMGKNFGKPLLQVNTNATGIITQILYQDSIHLSSIDQLDVIAGEPVIYPNPASNSIFIRYTLNKSENVSYEIYTSDGRKVFSKKDDNQSTGDRFAFLDLTQYNLPAGNYFLKINAGNTSLSRSLVIGN